MIYRRAIRMRAFQFLFSYFKQTPPPSLELLKKHFFQSLDKSYYFYLLILSLLDELRTIEINENEKQKSKFIKNEESSSVFSNHPFLLALIKNKSFHQKLNEYKVNFGNDKDWVQSIYKALKKNDIYTDYITRKDFSEENAFDFSEQLLLEFLYNNELLEHFFEDESQFAQNDLFFAINATKRTINEFKKNKVFTISPKYKDEISDKKFANELLDYTVQNYHDFDAYITKYSENWDLERIHFSDLLLLKMCMVELIYTSVPIKTSVDEYIEISKEYSSPQSYIFINGILMTFTKEAIEKGLIKKSP